MARLSAIYERRATTPSPQTTDSRATADHNRTNLAHLARVCRLETLQSAIPEPVRDQPNLIVIKRQNRVFPVNIQRIHAVKKPLPSRFHLRCTEHRNPGHSSRRSHLTPTIPEASGPRCRPDLSTGSGPLPPVSGRAHQSIDRPFLVKSSIPDSQNPRSVPVVADVCRCRTFPTNHDRHLNPSTIAPNPILGPVRRFWVGSAQVLPSGWAQSGLGLVLFGVRRSALAKARCPYRPRRSCPLRAHRLRTWPRRLGSSAWQHHGTGHTRTPPGGPTPSRAVPVMLSPTGTVTVGTGVPEVSGRWSLVRRVGVGEGPRGGAGWGTGPRACGNLGMTSTVDTLWER